MLAELLKKVLRPELGDIKPYTPEPGRYRIRLDANEAPPLLGERARQRLLEVVEQTAWERYPDAGQTELRQAIAEHCGVSAEQVLPGAGSDEVIAILLSAASHHDPKVPAASIVTTTPSFVMYRLNARVRGQRVIEVPLDDRWRIPEAGLRQAIEMTKANIVFIASPNNPTGTVAEKSQLTALISDHPSTLFIVDEAYVDYADEHHLDLARRFQNLCVLRTLSKIGFASIRVGWLLGAPELVCELDKVRQPYNLPTVCQNLARVVLSEFSRDVQAATALVKRERSRLEAAVAESGIAAVTPSQANFLWLRTAVPAQKLFEALKQKGILVRSFHDRGGRLAHQLRVTVGLPEENDEFLAALKEVA